MTAGTSAQRGGRILTSQPDGSDNRHCSGDDC
jgi:hypothetical protein